GALPICGNDKLLKGMLTDRDIVMKCIAEGGDPKTTTAGSLAEGKPVTIGADDDVREALRVMQDHQVRRLPVIDGHDLVGIISPRNLGDVGQVVVQARPVGVLLRNDRSGHGVDAVAEVGEHLAVVRRFHVGVGGFDHEDG
ncbi:MAG TPA: hypothetical protein DCR63_07545, partial [Microbacterium sp.]|nr:hypothetical protein [Microbacterium sp.]